MYKGERRLVLGNSWHRCKSRHPCSVFVDCCLGIPTARLPLLAPFSRATASFGVITASRILHLGCGVFEAWPLRRGVSEAGFHSLEEAECGARLGSLPLVPKRCPEI